MTPKQTALALRLAEHPRFAWAKGMLALPHLQETPHWSQLRITDVTDGILWHGFTVREPARLWVPALNDAATAGVLLALVCELAGTDGCGVYLAPDSEASYCCEVGDGHYYGRSAGEACAEALLALWSEP